MISSGFVRPTGAGAGTGAETDSGSPAGGGGRSIAFRRIAELGGLELVQAEIPVDCPPPHTVEEYVVLVLERGRARCVFGREGQLLVPGRVLLVAPGVPFAVARVGEEPVEHRSMLVACGCMLRAARIEAPGHVESRVVTDAALADRLIDVHERLMVPGPVAAPLASQLQETLGALASPQPAPASSGVTPSEPRRIRVIREHLAANLTTPASLDELSDLVGVSPFYLQRTFKAVTRMSPREYLMDLRIRRARQLLREGMSPRLVGSAIGFFDQSHFTRAFRKLTGVTPGIYATGYCRARIAGRGAA